MSDRLRFAPSPTGALHLGNARTALVNWLVARGCGGTLILRVEDTDEKRNVEGAEQRILEDLRWLGIDWDEGPDVGGGHGPYRQSQRRQLHQAVVADLLESGAGYYCFEDAAPADSANYTNRSPHPMLHLLREASITRALEAYPDPSAIPERNVARLRELGAKHLEQRLARCRARTP